MKPFVFTLLNFGAMVFLFPLAAETVYTIPQGYTKIAIPAGTVSGPSLTVISATLFNDVEFSGEITITGDYDADPDSDPGTPAGAQTLPATGASWTADQFTTEPHLAFVINGSGAEESFLITSHTADTLTVDAPYNLLADSRFTNPTTVKIRKAHTVGSILGTTATPFSINDRAFIWTGTNWQSLIGASGGWFYIGGPGGVATNAVVYPEEGIFIQRAELTGAVLTICGEVPSVPQAATVEGTGSTFISTRFPVGNSPSPDPTGIRLADLNIDEIPGWTSQDRAYFWTGTNWQTLLSVGTNWFYIGGPGGNANDLLIAPNSALFLTRASAGEASASPLTLQLPYTITTSE